ncbi:MAG: hypothetical protein VCF07_04075 [Nitrospinota bacterium]
MPTLEEACALRQNPGHINPQKSSGARTAETDPPLGGFGFQTPERSRGAVVNEFLEAGGVRYAIRWTRLSAQKFRDNAARLQFFPLACGLRTL